MSNILTIAFSTEGATDNRFLKTVITKVFEEVACGCDGIIEVYEPVFLEFPKNENFIAGVNYLSQKAFEFGINVLCIHVDADSHKDEQVLNSKIIPAFNAVKNSNVVSNCKNLVALIPVHMTEAWMLADKNLLKEEIGTSISNIDLGINRHPESISDPKAIIKNALIIAQAHLTARRSRINIGELYQPIGQKVKVQELERLNSFNKFKSSVRNAFINLNYLH